MTVDIKGDLELALMSQRQLVEYLLALQAEDNQHQHELNTYQATRSRIAMVSPEARTEAVMARIRNAIDQSTRLDAALREAAFYCNHTDGAGTQLAMEEVIGDSHAPMGSRQSVSTTRTVCRACRKGLTDYVTNHVTLAMPAPVINFTLTATVAKESA